MAKHPSRLLLLVAVQDKYETFQEAKSQGYDFKQSVAITIAGGTFFAPFSLSLSLPFHSNVSLLPKKTNARLRRRTSQGKDRERRRVRPAGTVHLGGQPGVQEGDQVPRRRERTVQDREGRRSLGRGQQGAGGAGEDERAQFGTADLSLRSWMLEV